VSGDRVFSRVAGGSRKDDGDSPPSLGRCREFRSVFTVFVEWQEDSGLWETCSILVSKAYLLDTWRKKRRQSGPANSNLFRKRQLKGGGCSSCSMPYHEVPFRSRARIKSPLLMVCAVLPRFSDCTTESSSIRYKTYLLTYLRITIEWISQMHWDYRLHV